MNNDEYLNSSDYLKLQGLLIYEPYIPFVVIFES